MANMEPTVAPPAQPLVSVAVPSYNHAPYVRECIEGLIAQNYKNIELIIIDDGSTDGSPAIIGEMAALCRERFTRFEFRARPNKGLCETLNEAIDWCRGEYFGTVDSDDVLLPAKTNVLVAAIESDPGLAGVFGGANWVDQDGRFLRAFTPPEMSYDFDDILGREKPFISSCSILRLDLIKSVGGYKKGLYIEDWYMWLRLTEHGARLKVIPEPLVLYRQHGTNISKNVMKMYEGRQEILNIFARYPRARLSSAMVAAALAIELSRRAKLKALSYLASAIGIHAAIVFRPIFWKSLGRVAAPVAVLNILKQMRQS